MTFFIAIFGAICLINLGESRHTGGRFHGGDATRGGRDTYHRGNSWIQPTGYQQHRVDLNNRDVIRSIGTLRDRAGAESDVGKAADAQLQTDNPELQTVYFTIEEFAGRLEGDDIIGRINQPVGGQADLYQWPLFRVAIDPSVALEKYANAKFHSGDDVTGKVYSVIKINVPCVTAANNHNVAVYPWHNVGHHLTFNNDYIKAHFDQGKHVPDQPIDDGTSQYEPLVIPGNCYEYSDFSAEDVKDKIKTRQQFITLIDTANFAPPRPRARDGDDDLRRLFTN